jgi:hypothetical protein
MMLRNNLVLILLLACENVCSQEWEFDVYLDKTKMGTHSFNLNDANQLLSKARFRVKLLFIEAYSYDHVAKEQWQGDCLKSIESDTTENKEVSKVTGQLKANVFNIISGEHSKSLPSCVMTFAYWNPKILKQNNLLNPQNGEFLETKIKEVGFETIEVKGKSTETTHFLLQGISKDIVSKEFNVKLNIDLWYDHKKNWVALQSITPEGYKIIYKLR